MMMPQFHLWNMREEAGFPRLPFLFTVAVSQHKHSDVVSLFLNHNVTYTEGSSHSVSAGGLLESGAVQLSAVESNTENGKCIRSFCKTFWRLFLHWKWVLTCHTSIFTLVAVNTFQGATCSSILAAFTGWQIQELAQWSPVVTTKGILWHNL